MIKGIFYILMSLTLINCAEKETAPDHLFAKKKKDQLEVNNDLKIPVELNPQVDILFVVDDSGSMGIHQANLARNIVLMVNSLKEFGQLDYKIGAITTSHDPNGPVSPGKNGGLYTVGIDTFVTPKTKNKDVVLQQLLKVGTGGSYNEKIFDPIPRAITDSVNNGWNRDFYRPNAYLALIFITDTGDSSEIYPGSDSLMNFLLQSKGGRSDKILSYGILSYSNYFNDICQADSEGPPIKILEFLRVSSNNDAVNIDDKPTNAFSLCDPVFGENIEEIGKDITSRITFRVLLPLIPETSTIKVMFGDKVIPHDPVKGWTYDPEKNALYFGTETKFGDDFTENEDIGDLFSVTFNKAGLNDEAEGLGSLVDCTTKLEDLTDSEEIILHKMVCD